MAKRESHKVNGRFYGMYYETDAGTAMYLAHRTRGQIYRDRYAWCLDISTLERCRSRGIKAVGVLVKEGTIKMIWLTHIDDFFDSPHSFGHMSTTRQRGLPLSRFRIDPSTSEKVITSAVKIK